MTAVLALGAGLSCGVTNLIGRLGSSVGSDSVVSGSTTHYNDAAKNRISRLSSLNTNGVSSDYSYDTQGIARPSTSSLAKSEVQRT